MTATPRASRFRKSHWAQRIDQPPYFGIAMRPGITFTYLGVKVDEDARVRREDGSGFENVFAAGEIMSGNVLSSGYLAGFGLTIGTRVGANSRQPCRGAGELVSRRDAVRGAMIEDLLVEGKRQLDICNSCRYCEGYCAVFPALERRIDLTKADMVQLANLCHDCRAVPLRLHVRAAARVRCQPAAAVRDASPRARR